VVVKRSGEREPFDRLKVVAGLKAACKNRPVDDVTLETLATEVEESLRLDGPEVTSQQIGLTVLDRLRRVDEVAYVRFASVYKGFDDASDFEREVGLLTKHTEPKSHE
jgi:transcriptional repressor NrdR